MTKTPALYGTRPARALGRFAGWTMRRDLRSHYRRAVRVGAPPSRDPAPGRPLVLVANHHVYHDSFLLWYWLTHGLGRRMVVWMEAWERAPLFGPIGALPFPADDPRERTRTIRETSRRLAENPATGLILYPEGHLGSPDDGLAPFQTDLPRLARLLPDAAAWVPTGLHATWWGESRPTLLLATGEARDAPDDGMAERVRDALAAARTARPDDLATGRAFRLLDGHEGPDERWDLSRLAPTVRRWM